MNDFTKEELKYLLGALDNLHANYLPNLVPKIQAMIDSFDLPENVTVIGSGELLFHNKESSSGLLHEISKHIALCNNNDDSLIFRIDWTIFFGKK